MTQTRSHAHRAAIAPLAVAGGVAAWLAHVGLVLAGLTYHWGDLLALALFGGSWIASRSLIGDIAERRVEEVDEYELDQRNHARNTGYVLTLGVLMMLFLYLTVAVKLSENGQRAALEQAPPLVFATFLLAAATPSFLLTWRLRTQTDNIDEGEL